jgi:hypothetical protein
MTFTSLAAGDGRALRRSGCVQHPFTPRRTLRPRLRHPPRGGADRPADHAVRGGERLEPRNDARRLRRRRQRRRGGRLRVAPRPRRQPGARLPAQPQLERAGGHPLAAGTLVGVPLRASRHLQHPDAARHRRDPRRRRSRRVQRPFSQSRARACRRRRRRRHPAARLGVQRRLVQVVDRRARRRRRLRRLLAPDRDDDARGAGREVHIRLVPHERRFVRQGQADRRRQRLPRRRIRRLHRPRRLRPELGHEPRRPARALERVRHAEEWPELAARVRRPARQADLLPRMGHRPSHRRQRRRRLPVLHRAHVRVDPDQPVAYHNYFEFADSVLDAALFGGRSPQAAKRFIELFGASATGDRSAAGAGPPPGAGPAAAVATDLRITKARISRRAKRVELLSPITRLASGRADVELFAPVAARRSPRRSTASAGGCSSTARSRAGRPGGAPAS